MSFAKMEQGFCYGSTPGHMLSTVCCKGAPGLQLLELPRLGSINDDLH